MALIGYNECTRSSIPDLYSLVVAARGDAFAIRRPCHASQSIGMSLIGEHSMAGDSIADLHSVIKAARGDVLAIGRPCRGEYLICMPLIGIRLNLKVYSGGAGGSGAAFTLCEKINSCPNHDQYYHQTDNAYNQPCTRTLPGLGLLGRSKAACLHWWLLPIRARVRSRRC